jgi:hypothetical protein
MIFNTNILNYGILPYLNKKEIVNLSLTTWWLYWELWDLVGTYTRQIESEPSFDMQFENDIIIPTVVVNSKYETNIYKLFRSLCERKDGLCCLWEEDIHIINMCPACQHELHYINYEYDPYPEEQYNEDYSYFNIGFVY